MNGQPARPRPGRGLRVIVHTTFADLLGLTNDLRLAETDRLGPVLVEQLRDWLNRHGSIATITPVIDLNRTGAVERRGPPGQTHPGNLAPLCRRHHLVKTHGGWRYQRNDDGTYTWANRHDHVWLVTPLGTINVGTIRLRDAPN